MGYTRHHAIIVSSWNEELLMQAYKEAIAIFGKQVSNVVDSEVNKIQTFFVGPDGSKRGWPEADLSDKKRDKFIQYLDSREYEDGSNCLRYCMVMYSDDNGGSVVRRHN